MNYYRQITLNTFDFVKRFAHITTTLKINGAKINLFKANHFMAHLSIHNHKPVFQTIQIHYYKIPIAHTMIYIKKFKTKINFI